MDKHIRFWLYHLEELLAGILIAIAMMLVLVNLFLRYFVHSSLDWSEEAAIGCFVWSVFLGIAAAYKNGAHLGVDFLVDRLPSVPGSLITLLVHVILAAANGYILYLSIFFHDLLPVRQAVVPGLPAAWISSSLVVAFGLTTIYAVLNLIQCIRKILGREES